MIFHVPNLMELSTLDDRVIEHVDDGLAQQKRRQHHRPLGVRARGDLALGERHLRPAAAHVHGEGVADPLVAPQDVTPDRTKFTLQTPGPYRYRRSARAYRVVTASP